MNKKNHSNWQKEREEKIHFFRTQEEFTKLEFFPVCEILMLSALISKDNVEPLQIIF